MNSRQVLILLAALACFAGSAVAHCATDDSTLCRLPKTGAAHPWTEKPFVPPAGAVRFAIVADAAGGYREGVLPDAVRKLNLLMPEFVVNVGDLIEGYSREEEEVDKWWMGIDSTLAPLRMPFFFVPGNHDLSNDMVARKWDAKFGPRYYHFVYRNVLFLCVNSQDGDGQIGGAQVEYFRSVLGEYQHVQWTMVIMHQPLWWRKECKGFLALEQMLQDRPYTMVAGHTHNYLKTERHGREYITVATNGGGSELRGPQFGEFDHLTMVTVTATGPVVATIELGAIHDQNVVTPGKEPLIRHLSEAARFSHSALLAPGGTFHDATTSFTFRNGANVPLQIYGTFDQNEQLRCSPARIDKQIMPGAIETVAVHVEGQGPVPAEKCEPMLFRWRISYPGGPDLSGTTPVSVESLLTCPRLNTPIVVDGNVDDWAKLPEQCDTPGQLDYISSSWHGPADCSFRFGTAFDDSCLYIAVRVTDDSASIHPLREIWEQDGVEIQLDARPRSSRDTLPRRGKGILAVQMTPGASTAETRIQEPERLPRGTRAVCVRSARGFNAEIAIPRTYLDAAQGKTWEDFRLNVIVYDHDGTESQYRGTKVFWKPDWEGMQNLAGAGTFVKETGKAARRAQRRPGQ